MLTFLYYAFLLPGYPFATFLSKIKEMGDGTDNETELIEFHIWATVFGIAVWVSIIVAVIWAWNNLSVSIHFARR